MPKPLTEKEIVVQVCDSDCPFFRWDPDCIKAECAVSDDFIKDNHDFPPDCPLHTQNILVRLEKQDE